VRVVGGCLVLCGVPDMPTHREGTGPQWPAELAEYRVEDGWECKLDWRWARYEAAKVMGLGSGELLTLLQEATAATVNPDVNPDIRSRGDDDIDDGAA
jgi:hypothetical protein